MLLLIAIRLVTLQSQVRCQVTTIDIPEINRNCNADRNEVCANLYFYDENDVLLHVVQGTDARIKRGEGGVKRVAKVQTMGDYGCYTIFKKTNFRSTNLCLNHTDRLNIREAGYGYSVVRYVLVQNIKSQIQAIVRPGLWSMTLTAIARVKPEEEGRYLVIYLQSTHIAAMRSVPISTFTTRMMSCCTRSMERMPG